MTPRLEAALGELAEAIRQEVRAELRDMASAPDRLLSVREAADVLGSAGRASMQKWERAASVPCILADAD